MIRKLSPALLLTLVAIGGLLHRTQAETSNRDAVFNQIYYVGDLPVWRVEQGEPASFDAKVLIAYIQAAVSTGSWVECEIRPLESKAALVISQTSDAHDQIADLLSGLRPGVAGETTENLREKSGSGDR